MSTYGLWLSAAGMKVSDYRQELLTNNMANANTIGFKHDLARVRERAIESQSSPTMMHWRHPVLDAMTGGADVKPTVYNFAQGPIEVTGMPMDVAIEGEGFFVVSNGKQTRYTRNGQFTTTADGDVVISSGGGQWKVLDDNSQPIRVRDNGEPVSVVADGTIRQGREIVATVATVTAGEKVAMRKQGANLFDAGSSTMTPAKASLRSGAIEQSNFNVMRGLASMIEASRAYEINANLLSLQDQSIAQAVGTVGRLA